MRQSACLVFNPIMVNNFASLFNCTPVSRASDSMMAPTKLFILVGWGRSIFVCCLAQRDSTVGFLLLQCSSGVVRHPGDLRALVATRCFCPHLCFIIVFICDLFVSRDDPLMSYKTFTRTEQLYVLSHDRSRGRVGIPLNRFKPHSNFY